MDVLCVGHAAWDISVFTAGYPAENSKLEIHTMIECGGGPAANAAFLLSRWGAAAAFAGVVGTDAYGERIAREFSDAGTDITLMRRHDGDVTPVSVILVNEQNGSRTIINRKAPRAGAPLRLARVTELSPTTCSPHPDPLPSQARGEGNQPQSRTSAQKGVPHSGAEGFSLSPQQRGEGRGEGPWQPNDSSFVSAPAWPQPPRVLLFDGHEPEASLEAMKLFPQAKSILDAGSLRDGTRELARRVDYVVASERFARELGNLPDLESVENQDAAVAALHRRNGKPVVITCGERGLLHGTAGRVERLPAFPVKACDTTAAGDIFHGAFAYGVLAGLPWVETLRLASATAALSVAARGGRTSIPTLAQVKEMLRHA